MFKRVKSSPVALAPRERGERVRVRGRAVEDEYAAEDEDGYGDADEITGAVGNS
jgi:hypothetical protein